jgi:hypothetical protein
MIRQNSQILKLNRDRSETTADRTYTLSPKKPGFLPNLQAARNIFVKKPGF